RTVAQGRSLLDPESTTRMLKRLREEAGRKDPLSELTEQESRVLELIGEGLTNREIGARMYLAEKTVKNYVSRVLAKLGMARRTQAAAYAVRLSMDQTGLSAGRKRPPRTFSQTDTGGSEPFLPRAGADHSMSVPSPGPLVTVIVPPSSSAREVALCRPLRLVTFSEMPQPLSETRSTTSLPATDSSTSTDVACACRLAFDSSSRSTATTCSPTCSSTALSSGPWVSNRGANPSVSVAVLTRPRICERSHEGLSSAGFCSAKIVDRICRIVSSRSSTAFRIRC